MSTTTAKKGIGFFIEAVALVLAVIGIVAMVVSGSMGVGYEFPNMPVYLVLSVVAIALVVVSMALDAKSADKGPGIVSLLALGVAVFILAYAGIQVVASRALNISAIFSWNSGDTTGWSMFYAAAASAGCMVVSAVLLTVAGFMPTFKRR